MHPNYPDLFLIRHGQTEWNAQGRLQGHLDSPLTEKGRAQARALAPLVRDLPARRIVSPLGRAVETARLIFGDDHFTLDTRLAEIDVGEFAGRRLPDLRRDHPDLFTGARLAWYDCTPGGETYAALMARSRQLLDEIDGPAVLITHGITLRMLRLIAMGQPMAKLDAMPTVQGAVHVITAGKHQVRHP